MKLGGRDLYLTEPENQANSCPAPLRMTIVYTCRGRPLDGCGQVRGARIRFRPCAYIAVKSKREQCMVSTASHVLILEIRNKHMFKHSTEPWHIAGLIMIEWLILGTNKSHLQKLFQVLFFIELYISHFNNHTLSSVRHAINQTVKPTICQKMSLSNVFTLHYQHNICLIVFIIYHNEDLWGESCSGCLFNPSNLWCPSTGLSTGRGWKGGGGVGLWLWYSQHSWCTHAKPCAGLISLIKR